MKCASVRLKVSPFSKRRMVLMLIPVLYDTSCCVICKAIRVALNRCPRKRIILAGDWFCASNLVFMVQKYGFFLKIVLSGFII